MFDSSPSAKWLWLLALLLVANVASYVYSNWGLVTVKVTDAPLSKVISSIEWQGWVKIYTNLPLDTKVTMYVDHAPLAEAMESLAANVDIPAPTDGDDGGGSNGERPARPFGRLGNLAGISTNNAPTAGAPNGPGSPDGPPGGRGGGGGGGFGRRAEWNLAFFVGPTSTQVKQEIREFQSGDPNDNNKVFTYNTQMQLFSSDTVTTAPDPRQQSWPGVRPVDKSAVVATDPPANATAPASNPTDPPATPVPAVQTYLQDLAQSANIWIMAPGNWTPDVSSMPPPGSSIIRAVASFVSSAHGVVTQAFILRTGRGGARGGTQVAGAGGGNDDAWADRMRNAINGLPADERPDAVEQLTKEIEFRKQMRNLPPEQRRQKMLQHFAERMLYGDRSRLSPEKRAKGYQRLITMRQAAKAQK